MTSTSTFSTCPVKASNIIGKDVVNPEGENLGDIKEVMVDPASGKVAYAVVSFGGFLGMGEKLFAVPYNALDYDSEDHEYVLNVPKEDLKNAPGFDPKHWPSMADEKWNREVYNYYKRTPYWEN